MTERKRSRRRPPTPSPTAERAQKRASRGLWLYGTHAVLAALANPDRTVHELCLTARSKATLAPGFARALAARGAPMPAAATLAAERIDALLPRDATHQGVAARVEPLANRSLADTVSGAAAAPPVLVLDRVSDPRNAGAILRSAAVFGVQAVVVPNRHAPPETGALAKAASGALERVAMVRVANLARALEALKDKGFWVIGLDPAAPVTLAQAGPGRPAALVLGAEGQGLRRLTAERCDVLARLSGAPHAAGGAADFTSLNVSNAAAVALYELTRAP